MSTDADLVREALDDLNYGHEGDAYAALARLETRIAEQDERLMAYETPGWINSVQKVMEERRRAEVAEAERDHYRFHFDQFQARCERLEGALRKIRQWDMLDVTDDGPYWKRTLDAALAEEPHADVPGAGQRGC